ncbi:MAG: RNB domain-containing ribonuclease [Nitrospiraceae bacterium]|nr:RNB domain-containing ribonuclease [Nitrospiraceae bacterium]
MRQKQINHWHRGDHRAILRGIARRAMLDRGLLPDFSPEAIAQLNTIDSPAKIGVGEVHDLRVRDLRGLPWASIDNDDSRDLDQLTAAERLDGADVKILVAIADVDVLVKKGSALDGHASHNTTSVYTPAIIFPMLPEKLSAGLTSLNLDEDRLAIVIEMTVGADGSVRAPDIYEAVVCNHAKLAYNSLAAWLEGRGPVPAPVAAASGFFPLLEENLRLQDETAQRLKRLRHEHGALSLQTIEASPRFEADVIIDLEAKAKNRANDLIEDFMIAANSMTSRYLASKGLPSLRRVVRTPLRWNRIVELAMESGYSLPRLPDAVSLEHFLREAQAKDPARFPDLSLSVIKLLGPGEYVFSAPGEKFPDGHFSLAVKGYSHSTAPNRRFPDLITQRLLKTAFLKAPGPYSISELEDLARHCTEEENAAKKVERQVGKSAAALLFESRIGQRFDSIVTGAGPKGTWVRLLHPPVEGKVVAGYQGLDIGARVQVRLVHVNVEAGFIDFERI